jgi:hypothetical protein
MLALGLIGLVGAALTDWTTEQADNYRLDEDYIVAPAQTRSFATSAGKYCPGKNIHVAVHTIPQARDAACINKCAAKDPLDNTQTPADCDGFIAAYDGPDAKDVVCLAEAPCKELCLLLPECHSIDVAVDQAHHKRCYLNTISCEYDMTVGLASDPNYNLLKKVITISDACDLGYGARITASSDPYEVAGIYDLEFVGAATDTKEYVKVGGGGRIVWHASSCGWAVEKPLPTSRVRKLDACPDAPAAAAAALGLPASDDEVCQRAAWAPAYCADPLFAAFCPATCAVPEASCAGDDKAAAEMIAQHLGVQGGCAELTRYCSSNIVATVCSAACAVPVKSRRGRFTFPAANFSAAFRASLRTVNARKLGFDMAGPVKYYEVYYNFKPLVAPYGPTSCTASAVMPETSKLYDVFALVVPKDQEWSQSCGVLPTYQTVGGMYCPHNNIQTYPSGAYTPLDSLAAARCVTKCASPHQPGCTGLEPNYDDATSNALCLGRAACENLCTELREAGLGCKSFDMHQTKERCFLNNGDYCLRYNNAGFNTYGRDVIAWEEGIYEPGTYDFVYLGYGIARYSTNDQKECGGDPYDVSTNKHSCEMKCSYPDFSWKVVHNGRDNTTNLTAHFHDAGDNEWAKAITIDSGYVLNFQYSSVALGTVNSEDGEIYFGPKTDIPIPADSHATWGSVTPVMVPKKEGSVKCPCVDEDMAMGYGSYCLDWDSDGKTWCFIDEEKCSFKDFEAYRSATRSMSTCTATDSLVKIFLEYPGIGIGAITGTLDYKNAIVEFTEDAELLVGTGWEGAKDAFVTGAVFPGGASESPVLLSVTTRDLPDTCTLGDVNTGVLNRTAFDLCAHPMGYSVYSLSVSPSAVSATAMLTGGALALKEDCEFTYFEGDSYSYSRRLEEESYSADTRQLHVPKHPGLHLDDIDAKTNWTSAEEWMIATAATNAAVTSAIYSVGGKTVYMLANPTLTVKLQAVDPSSSCGFAKPMTVALTMCEKPAGMPIPGTSKILVTCAGRKGVICDIEKTDSPCGTIYSDFGELFNSTDTSFDKSTAMASEGGLAGECLSDKVCILMSEVQTFYLLGIDNQEISYVNFIENLKDIKDWKIKRDLVLINKETMFLSSTVVSAGGVAGLPTFSSLTSIQDTYPVGDLIFPVGNGKTEFEGSVVGYTQGILIKEKGLTWEYHDPTTECKWYTEFRKNVSGIDICGSRQECEDACTADPMCSGFTYAVDSYRCHFYASCPLMGVPPEEPTITVKKEETAPCKTTVSGAVVPQEVMDACVYDGAAVESSCDINGEYIKAGKRTYLKSNNVSMIYADPAQPCAGWVLAMNTASVGKIMLIKYKDASPAAVAGVPLDQMFDFAARSSAPPAPVDCAQVLAMGLCGDSPYTELCMTTCVPLTMTQVAGVTKGFHLQLTTTGYAGVSFDMDAAAGEYLGMVNASKPHSLHNPESGLDTLKCKDVCTKGKNKQSRVATAYPTVNWLTIQALCPEACKTKDSPKTYEKEEQYYLPADFSTFTVLFRTFANGSDYAQEQPDAAWDIDDLDYSQCDYIPPFGFKDFMVAETKLTTTKVYSVIVEETDNTLGKVCSTIGRCPTLTSCVVDEDRLIVERTALGVHDKKTPIGQIADLASFLDSPAWQDYVAPGALAKDLTDDSILFKFPKVLLSTDRTEASIRVALWDFGKEIFRPVPDHTRVRLYEAGTASTVFITMSPAFEWATLMNFGRTYTNLPGYNSLMTDVIRIAAFTPAAEKISTGTFTFEIWFPESIGSEDSFVVYTYLGVAPTPVTAIGGVVAQKPNAEYGWWSVTVPAAYANGDFAGTIDLNECALGTDGCERDGGSCINTVGSYYCTCNAGFFAMDAAKSAAGVPVPSGTQCIKNDYEPVDSQFLLYHTEKAEYGWKVGEIMLFEASDPDTGVCMGECQVGKGDFSPDCHYGKPVNEATANAKGVLEMTYANGDVSNTYIRNVMVSETYPGKDPNRLKDGKLGPSFEWWSKDLELDRLSGTGAWISFEVAAGTKVNCVRLYMACTAGAMTSFTLFRGKQGTAAPGLAYSTAGLPLYTPGEAGWLEIASATRAKDANYVDFAVPCGIRDAQYFGELFPHSYTDVPTACACKQLCMDNVDEGCTSWKWYEETEHCILQKNYFTGSDPLSDPDAAEVLSEPRAAMRSQYEKGTGWWKLPFADGWPGWWTGTPGAIVLGMSTMPAMVTVGAPFSLKLSGVGFPLDESMQNNLGARQRIKIVLAGSGPGSNCGTDVPPEYVEGIGCTNGLTCSSRPASFDRVSATWSGLKFASSLASAEYKVCWCAGHCYDMASWKEVPGSLSVSASPYSWALETPAVLNPYSFAPVLVRVSRPAFSSTAPAANWRLKLVSEDYTCETLGTSDLTCNGLTGCSPGTSATDSFGAQVGLNLGPDEAVFYLSTGSATGVSPGYYHVCLTEDGSTFSAIPSLTARFMVVTKLASDPSHPRGPFHHQKFSMRAGQKATISVSGYRMHQPNAASVYVIEAANCFTGGASKMALTADAAASTADSYVFTGTAPSTLGGSSTPYTLCYCEDPAYTYEAAKKFDSPLNATLLGTYSKDLCVKKCTPGCVGSTCFCDGMEATDEATYGMSEDGPLCLDAPACRAACDAIDGCTGYSAGSLKPRCFLTSHHDHKGGTDTTTDENFDAWTKVGGTCSAADAMAATGATADEVAKNLGTVYVTQKADLGVSYVVTPGAEASIELTGTSFTSGDRIMVIDCFGTCGFTEGSSFVSAPDYAVLPTLDRPSQPELTPVYPDTSAATYSYQKTPSMYCPGNMLPVVADTLHAGHLCYKKCYASESCTDSSCFCGGFILGYDTAESTSVCLDTQQCHWLCSHTPGCHSIDMHKSLDRCFLNMETCADTIVANQLVPDSDYDLFVKLEDDNTRRLQERGKTFTKKLVRQLLAAEDPGISWDSMYRFKDLTFSSGGEFKLCFCDSSILPGTNNFCDKAEDYTIEVGKIHATGLQCLLNDPKMTKGTCVQQFYGGLRCYDGAAPAVTVPTDYLGVPNPLGQARSSLVTSLITYCQFAPEEDALEFPFCSQYRVYETVPTPAPTKKGKR